jgi:hypothetical protein
MSQDQRSIDELLIAWGVIFALLILFKILDSNF